MRGLSGAADVRVAMRAIAERRADLIKVMMTQRAGVRTIEHGTLVAAETLALMRDTEIEQDS